MTASFPIQVGHTCIVGGEPFSLRLMQQVCEQAYLEHGHMDISYLILSEADNEKLRNAVGSLASVYAVDASGNRVDLPPESPSVTKVLNQTTGGYVDIFASSSIQEGTLIFGSYQKSEQ